MPHLRYLRYVLIHKLYVLRAGLVIGRLRGAPAGPFPPWTRWLWRLLVHDLSKFRPSEWRPYAMFFYGERPRDAQARFNHAWLLHIHRNPHHWQHWILHEDSGKTLVLLPESWVADEMVADWMAAGQKILAWPSLLTCVAETIRWYAANHTRMHLREPLRQRVEETLMGLAAQYGLAAGALEMRAAEQARRSIVVPGRAHAETDFIPVKRDGTPGYDPR